MDCHFGYKGSGVVSGGWRPIHNAWRRGYGVEGVGVEYVNETPVYSTMTLILTCLPYRLITESRFSNFVCMPFFPVNLLIDVDDI